MALTADQTTDMLTDLASGALDAVFTQVELDRFYTRAGDDYNLAVYYGWRQILANSATWVNYQVAQTKVERGAAFDHIKAMLALWQNESRTAANQVLSVGLNQVPNIHKPVPANACRQDGYFRRGRWYPY